MDWLESIMTTPPLLAAVANTKTQQFAAEAMALDIMDMRRIQTVSRRRALLVCLLHQAQVHTRDQLVEMFTQAYAPHPDLSEGETPRTPGPAP